MIAFAVAHTVIMKLGLSFWSEFLDLYNLETFWGRPVYGVPLGEPVWALVYGAGWPLFVSYFLDLKLTPDQGRRRGESQKEREPTILIIGKPFFC